MATRTNQPLVSVVMVVRNVDRFLAEAIESILSQSFADFEFVILDFGSTDRSKAIASSYAARDNRIRLHEVPACGLAEARNAVCFLAQGQYIAIQDADDISMSDRLLWQVEFLEKHRDVGLLGGASQWVDAQAENVLFTLNFPTEDRDIKSELAIRCPFTQTAVLLRREAFLAVDGYRAAFAPSEDYDLWVRISERFRCANLKQAVVKYRIHPQQVSVRRRQQQTLCAVAARASAAFRKNGSPDPFDSVKAITPELLTLHVSPAELQASLFRDYLYLASNMFSIKEYAVALEITSELSQSEWECVERWQVAYLQLLLARLYWRKRQFQESFFAACRAARPALAKNFGVALLHRISKLARA